MYTTVDIFNQINNLIQRQSQGVATTTANTVLASVSSNNGLNSSTVSVSDVVSAMSAIIGAIVPPQITSLCY